MLESSLSIINNLIKLTKNNKIKWEYYSGKYEELKTEIKITKNKYILFNIVKMTNTMYMDYFFMKKDNKDHFDQTYLSTIFLDSNNYRIFELFIFAKYVNFMLNNKNFYNDLNDLNLDWIVLKSIDIIKLELESSKIGNKLFNSYLYISEFSRPYLKINNIIIYSDLTSDRKQYIKLYNNIRKNQ